jgi:SNF2 family DNA or RNA helicase
MNGSYENLITGESVQGTPKFHRGGILADDMGLGKTVTSIYYLAHKVANTPHFEQTLVVVPTNLIHQWRDEMKRFIEDFNDCFISFYTS